VDLQSDLEKQAQAWDRNPLLGRLYGEWYEAIVRRLAAVPGPSIELGSGIGKLSDVAGSRITLTDVEATRWTRERVDALNLPYEVASLANVVMLDVFHHLADPARFLNEARRALAPGGRVVMVEPYCSTVSTPLYRRFHHERTDLAADPFSRDDSIGAAPMESNQALPTLVFFRHLDLFRRRWPELAVREARRFAFLAYPLSGGFSRPALLPLSLYPAIRTLERVLAPLAPVLAFRCLVVLEREA
jgi:SAM-dependent methyltransferase